MGLDMYLFGKRYLNRWSTKGDAEIAEKIKNILPELQDQKIYGFFGEECPIREITIEIGYWRKANQIHNWFVKNVQNGKDDCGYYDVFKSQLQSLKKTVEEVLKDESKAPELLPTSSGFFFGGTDYDEYYFMDLQQTQKILDFALNLGGDYTFEYHSSW